MGGAEHLPCHTRDAEFAAMRADREVAKRSAAGGDGRSHRRPAMRRLERCRADAHCYVGEMASAANQDQKSQFVAIDHLSPRGSKEIAAKLWKAIDENARSGNPELAYVDAPLKRVAYRIATRAD